MRRVRVVAQEVGVQVERIEGGQAVLQGVSPIRKVPVATIDGKTLFESRVIIDWLTTTRGWGSLVPSRERAAGVEGVRTA
ncbi:MAG: glutathione S-transferase N-terminal domain-containing protein [Deltaproteobacteria bacterium]|nr:glutathione S-transferase N-terminal domain-containing protein [Deltaproteobacteria bacterium]MDQ3295580.1 glutathione S-transferase N-terminal domain-containing protein [Myxococcota bacterium]